MNHHRNNSNNTWQRWAHTVVISLGVALAALPAQAHHIINSTLQGEITSTTGLGTNDPVQVSSTIVSAFLGILGVIAVVLILAGGFKWMTSGGNEENVMKAKKLLSTSTLGLLIILAAYGIALYVFSIIESATGQQAF